MKSLREAKNLEWRPLISYQVTFRHPLNNIIKTKWGVPLCTVMGRGKKSSGSLLMVEQIKVPSCDSPSFKGKANSHRVTRLWTEDLGSCACLVSCTWNFEFSCVTIYLYYCTCRLALTAIYLYASEVEWRWNTLIWCPNTILSIITNYEISWVKHNFKFNTYTGASINIPRKKLINETIACPRNNFALQTLINSVILKAV